MNELRIFILEFHFTGNLAIKQYIRESFSTQTFYCTIFIKFSLYYTINYIRQFDQIWVSPQIEERITNTINSSNFMLRNFVVVDCSRVFLSKLFMVCADRRGGTCTTGTAYETADRDCRLGATKSLQHVENAKASDQTQTRYRRRRCLAPLLLLSAFFAGVSPSRKSCEREARAVQASDRHRRIHSISSARGGWPVSVTRRGLRDNRIVRLDGSTFSTHLPVTFVPASTLAHLKVFQTRYTELQRREVDTNISSG